MSFESFTDKMPEIKPEQGAKDNIVNFDPDKRKDISENRTSFQENDTKFNPDKRMDINEGNVLSGEDDTKFDPDNRLANQAISNYDTKYDQKYSLETEVKSAEDKVPEKIKCKNEDLAGRRQPDTGVFFEKKIVEVYDKLYEVVVPRFDSMFDAQLPEDKLKETDYKQFKECNAQLKEAVANNPEMREKFNDEQLEQIENGETPDGYTWHHDAEVGKMQLVDTEIHQKTGHTGGRAIWGSGTESR